MKKHYLKLLLVLSLIILPKLIYAQDLELQLTPSFYGDFNISCFGGRTGSINLEVTNGTPPYTYQWSNEATTQDISNLAAGYYEVIVYDDNGWRGIADITLIEPEPFIFVGLSKYVYPNGKNVSCHFCFDGAIATSIEQGIPPYTFQWLDGAITQDRTGINAGDYTVIVTDANGCSVEASVTLNAPNRDDWTTTGNASTSSNFIGTTNPTDLVFKTNSNPRITVGQSGSIKFNSMTGSGTEALFIDNQGNLLRGPTFQPYWGLGGNVGVTSSHYIGTKNNEDLVFKTYADDPTIYSPAPTNPGERMRIKANGQIAIGTNTISGSQILTVAGNSYFNGKVGVGVDNPTANLQVEKAGSNEVELRVYNSTSGSGSGRLATMTVMNSGFSYGMYIDDANLGHIFQNYGNKNSVMAFNNYSEIGIGTNPISGIKLAVSGNSFLDGDMEIGTTNSTTNRKLELKSNDSRFFVTNTNTSSPSINLKNNNGYWHLSGPRNETNNPFSLFWTTDGSNFTRYLTLLDNGNLGIGNDAPDSRLVVSSNASDSRIKLVNTTSNPSTFWALNSLYSYGFGVKTHQINGEGENLGHIYSNVSTSDIVMTFTSDKKVGIGNITSIMPKEAFQIGDWLTIHDGGNKVFGYNFTYDGTDKRINDGSASAIYFSSDGSISMKTSGNDLAGENITWSEGIKINAEGNVGIGEEPAQDYKLVVNGKIGGSEMRLTLTRPWPDYVFGEEYELMPIKQLENFVATNNHLPGLDNASCIEADKGFDVGSLQVKLLEKVEELTLYIIQINEQNNLLKQKITELENKIK